MSDTKCKMCDALIDLGLEVDKQVGDMQDRIAALAAENAALRESVSRYEAALERANRYGREQDIELAALRELYGAAWEVSDILFRASLSSNWNTHGVAILDAHAKLAAALKEPANG